MNPYRSAVLRRVFSAGLLGMALLSLLAAVGLEAYLLPYLALKHPAATGTPYFRETQATLLFLCRYLALASGVAAILMWCLPIENVPWQKMSVAVLLVGSVLRLATPDMALHSVHKPDGVHYQLLAMSLVSDHSFTIPAGISEVPSRMPVGPSLVMALTSWLNPGCFGMGVFSIWLSSVLTLWLMVRTGRRVWNADTGLLAAVLLAVSPLHSHFSRNLMGEIPWALATLAAFHLVVCGPPTAWRMGTAGLILGLSMLFKPVQLGLMAAFGLAMAVGLPHSRLRQRLGPLMWLGMGALIGCVPLLLYQRFVLGGWLITGYHLYDLAGAAMEKLFSLSYLFGPDVRGRGFGTVPGYLLAFSGFDPRPENTPWYFPLSLLLLWSPFTWKHGWKQGTDRQRLAVAFTVAATVLFAGPFLLYAYQQPRFLLPVLPLWTLLMAAAAASTVARWQAARLLTCVLWGVLAVLLAMVAAQVRVQAGGVREPERMVMERIRPLMEDYDGLATDEEPLLMTHFGIWRAGHAMIPIRAPGQPWLTDQPAETLRLQRSVSRPFEGPVPAIEERLRQGQRVALWMRYPHRNRQVGDDLRRHFTWVARPDVGLSDWYEVRLREKSGPPGP